MIEQLLIPLSQISILLISLERLRRIIKDGFRTSQKLPKLLALNYGSNKDQKDTWNL